MIRVVNPGRPGPRRHNPDSERSRAARERVLAARTYLITPAELRGAAARPDKDKLAFVRPYLATAVLALVPTECNHRELTTAAVDSSWRLYYNVDFVLGCDMEAMAAVIEHEVWHLLRRHPERFEVAGIPVRLHKIWNRAVDAEIHNDDRLYERLLRTGIKPINAASLGCEPGLSAEEYFNFLMEHAKIKEDEHGTTITIDPSGGDGGGEDSDDEQGDDEGGGGGGYGDSEGDEEGGDGEGGGGGSDSEDDGQQSGGGGPGKIVIYIPKDPADSGPGGTGNYNESGSSASGVQQPWELPPTDDYVDRSTEEAIRRDTVNRIRDEQSMQRGTQPSSAELAWANSEIEGKVDWREELASAISEAYAYVSGSSEFTRRKLSRRQAASDFVMAGLQHPVPEIAIVIDVSGSMYASYRAGDSEAGKNYNLLQQAIGETASIVEQFGQLGEGVQVFATSTTVDWVGRIYDANDIKIPEDGGGTDIGVGMQAAYWSDPTPNIMVVLTDGYTPWPDDAPPDVEVVIGIIGSNETETVGGFDIPTWARVIWINK